MKPVKDFFRNHISFSYTESSGFVVLIIVLFFCTTGIYLFKQYTDKPYSTSLASDQQKLDSLLRTLEKNNTPKAKLKLFNPNTASLEELTEIGISETVASRIIKYRSKGGKFRIKSDLSKIYGITDRQFEELAVYIDLPETITKPTITKKEVIEKKKILADLNIAKANDLIKVKGIGPVLSERIIKFRSALGGFVNTDQLYEVFALDSLVVQELKEHFFVNDSYRPARINVNHATLKDLYAHPYIDYKKAEALVKLRKENPLSSFGDLEASGIFSAKEILKLRPYLSISVSSNELEE